MRKNDLSILLFFVFCLFPHLVFSSDTDVEQTAEKIKTAIDQHLDNNNLDSASISANILLGYASSEDIPFYMAQANYSLGLVHQSGGNIDSCLLFLHRADSLFGVARDTLWRGMINTRIAFIHRGQNNADLAVEYYFIALEYLEQAGDTLWYGVVNDHLGHVFFDKGNYYRSLAYFQNAISVFTMLGNNVYMGAEYNAIGLIYRKTKDKEKEKQAYLNAIGKLSEVDETVYLAEAYSNLSELYLEEGLEKEGFEMLERAKQIFLNIDNPRGLCSYYAVLAFYYDHSSPPDYAKVIDFGQKGAAIALENESYRQYADATCYLGGAYLKTNQLQKARNILEKGYQFAEQYGYFPELEKISRELSAVYKEIKLPDKALELLEQHLMLKDSLSGEERIKEFTNLDLSFKFRQEQYQDSLLQVRQEQEMNFQHEKELQVQKNRQLILAFILLVIFIVAVFVFLYARRRKAQNLILDHKNTIINKSLHEKELLLKEIHHRVKNNFQTISSLLELQSKEVVDEQAIINIEEGRSRIHSMALIHQKLYQKSDLSVIEMQDYLEQLSSQIAHAYSLNNLEIIVNANNIQLDIDTSIPLGLMLNELITNSCKYAFKKDVQGELNVEITKQEDGSYLLVHQDSGPGLPEGINLARTKSLGLRLVQRLTRQLHGTFSYGYDNGCRFEITFNDTVHRKIVE
nr:hypothetical protein [Bacteroidota bacterium]